jgi:hypothetical protein
MKRKAIIALMLVAVLGIASVSWASTVLYEDKFTSMDPGWGAPDKNFNIKDGKMTVQPNAKETYTAIYEGNIFPNNMDAGITVKFVKAPDPNWGAGLLFWSSGIKNFYGVLINANGWYTVQRRMGSRFINPVSWRQSDAIKKGTGVENRLRVETKDDKTTIFINDKEVISLTGTPPEGGSQIGVRVASGDNEPNVIEFTDLKVEKP